MNLIFSYVHPSKPSRTLGPFDAIWLSCEGMRCTENGEVRARYHKHQWGVDGLDYFRLDCTAKVSVHFLRGRERSSKYGPYGRFSAVNGLTYGDDSVIACLDYKLNEWLFYDSGYHWPLMVVTKANAG
jgi:hypothetical protein